MLSPRLLAKPEDKKTSSKKRWLRPFRFDGLHSHPAHAVKHLADVPKLLRFGTAKLSRYTSLGAFRLWSFTSERLRS